MSISLHGDKLLRWHVREGGDTYRMDSYQIFYNFNILLQFIFHHTILEVNLGHHQVLLVKNGLV